MDPEDSDLVSPEMGSEFEAIELSASPLCVFTLSPAFQPVPATSRRQNNVSRDRRCSLARTRPRFKRQRANVLLSHYLRGGERGIRRRQDLNVEDVLNTIRQVWKTPQDLLSSSYQYEMDGERLRKISYNSMENCSPMLLRRRLSAPEIVMRKHTLAQQHCDSQDSDGTQSSDVKSCQFRNEFSLGSDSSLNRKRDSGYMRKSTLLRRLWSNSKPQTEASNRTSYDFSCRSFGSSKSSPKTSPKHSINTMDMPLSPKRLQHGSAMTSMRTTTDTDFDTYTVTASLNNSDSAFSNSRSHFTESTNSGVQKVISGSSNTYTEDVNRNDTSSVIKDQTKTSETQTLSTTNVNVISNVQLSKTTLDIIYNQVLKDVQDVVPNVININTLTVTPNTNTINVKQVPSFYLKRGEEEPLSSKHDPISKYMISNVGTGSSYSRPAEPPLVTVPRLSAYPRTASMEVNASSADSTDRESDTISLVDSLEDTSSPHTELSLSRHDDKPVRGCVSSLLPDNSDMKTQKRTNKAFFIPIETDVKLLEKAVSEHLPERVRERLSRRQIELKSKAVSPRSDSNYVSSSDSHRLHIVLGDSSGNDGANVKLKRRSKPFLPSIHTTRKIKIDSRDGSDSLRNKRSSKRQFTSSKVSTKSKTQAKSNSKPSPLYKTKNEYHYDATPNRIYHKTELNNANQRIEILEIMECVDVTPERYAQHPKGKSKIPVLVQPKLPKINQQKPTFLEVEEVRIEDPKIDQLIANILIDTLNKIDDSEQMSKVSKEQKQKKIEDEKKTNIYSYGNKYQQKFEVIPEEFLQTSTENNNNELTEGAVENEHIANNNAEEGNTTKVKEDLYKGKAALALVKDDNLSTIPQGWITFYMLQKSQGSPDSASDEGKASNENVMKFEDEKTADQPSQATTEKENSHSLKSSSHTDSEMNANMCTALPHVQNRYKRKIRSRNSHTINTGKQPQQRGWTVTVSGTNSSGDFAPNLEMKLNFPQSNQENIVITDPNIREEQTHIRTPESVYEVSSNENDKFTIDSHRCRFPNIDKGNFARKGKRCDSLSNEPRQTKTSSTRMSMNRPKPQLPLLNSNFNFNGNSDFNLDERHHLEDLLQRFPHFLSVTGNAIYQKRGPRIYAITESDVMRYVNHN